MSSSSPPQPQNTFEKPFNRLSRNINNWIIDDFTFDDTPKMRLLGFQNKDNLKWSDLSVVVSPKQYLVSRSIFRKYLNWSGVSAVAPPKIVA